MILLHNGNGYLSVPLAHAANMKESYESMKLLLGKIKYDEFRQKLRVDLQVVALLLRICGTVTRNATQVHKILLFPARVGQPDKKNHYVNKL